jgi:hypothetical protein
MKNTNYILSPPNSNFYTLKYLPLFEGKMAFLNKGKYMGE